LAGEGSSKFLARQWSIPERNIRNLACRYRLNAINGLVSKHWTFCTRFKLQVLSHLDCEPLSSRQVGGMARSTFYYQVKTSKFADQKSVMEAGIRAVYDEHKGRYGCRRIAAALSNSMARPDKHKCVPRLSKR